MLLRLLLEGVGLGALLVRICALGIRKGAVGMVHLYHEDVQSRTIAQGLITKEQIRKNSLRFKRLCIPGYLAYVLVCVYALNGARGFLPGFWQLFVILSIMNVIDRLLIDDYWVGHTDAWVIPARKISGPTLPRRTSAKNGASGRSAWPSFPRSLPGLWR